MLQQLSYTKMVSFYKIKEPGNPKKVLVKKLVLVSEGQTEKTLDLSGDLSQLKQTVFTIKEGVQYRIRIEFYVQHEIVTGLKYIQKTYRKGIQGIFKLQSGSKK
jgi:Rho GDP-dissociation inhibitor